MKSMVHVCKIIEKWSELLKRCENNNRFCWFPIFLTKGVRNAHRLSICWEQGTLQLVWDLFVSIQIQHHFENEKDLYQMRQMNDWMVKDCSSGTGRSTCESYLQSCLQSNNLRLSNAIAWSSVIFKRAGCCSPAVAYTQSVIVVLILDI